MGGWKKRLAEVRDRNPDALPGWLRGERAGPAWYRAEWQFGAGVVAADSARPAVVVLGWLAGRGLLKPAGTTALAAAQSGEFETAALTPAMVAPVAALFLDAAWETWWRMYGINLAIGPKAEAGARAALDAAWQQFTPEER